MHRAVGELYDVILAALAILFHLLTVAEAIAIATLVTIPPAKHAAQPQNKKAGNHRQYDDVEELKFAAHDILDLSLIHI